MRKMRQGDQFQKALYEVKTSDLQVTFDFRR